MGNYILYNGQLIDGDELYHHGIKGQKWGKRRYQNPDGSLTPEGEARYARKEAVRDRRADLKNRRTMSDQELRKKVERLRLEKEFKNLTDDDVNKGKKACNKVLSRTGAVVGTVVTAAAVGVGIYAVKNYIAGGPKGSGFKQRWDWQKAADSIKLKK